LDLTVALENFVDEKVSALKKLIDAEFFVEVEKETGHHKKGQIFNCQLEVRLPGKSLVSKSNSDDLNKAIVDAKNGMEQEIKKYKFKKIDRTRRLSKKTKTQIVK